MTVNYFSHVFSVRKHVHAFSLRWFYRRYYLWCSRSLATTIFTALPLHLILIMAKVFFTSHSPIYIWCLIWIQHRVIPILMIHIWLQFLSLISCRCCCFIIIIYHSFLHYYDYQISGLSLLFVFIYYNLLSVMISLLWLLLLSSFQVITVDIYVEGIKRPITCHSVRSG